MTTSDCLSFMAPIKIITESLAQMTKRNIESSDLHVDDYDCDYVSVKYDTDYLTIQPCCKINCYLLNLFRRNKVFDGAGFYDIRI